MLIRKLSNELKAAHGRADVHSRVKPFSGWMDRERVEKANVNGYDHVLKEQSSKS